MSDPLEEAYNKYINPPPKDEDPGIQCPACESDDVDHSRGYRGEYTCRSCGHFWRA